MKLNHAIIATLLLFTSLLSFSITSATVSRIAGASRLTSIALTDEDLPVVAHYDNIGGNLDLVVCQNVACTNRTPVVVDFAGVVGSYPSIVLRNNIPLISYFDDTNDDLKLAICNDEFCSAPTLNSIATIGQVGQFTSLALTSAGFPVISYQDLTQNLVRLLVCQDLNCTTTPVIYDIASTSAATTSLQIRPDGVAVIAYVTVSNGLSVVTCQLNDCSNTLTNNAIDTAPQNFSHLVLDSNNFPAIAYNSSGAGFRLVRCNTLDCSGTPTITTLSSANPVDNVGFDLDENDIPTMAFSTISETSVVYCSTPTCTAPTIEIIESGNFAGDSMDLVLDSDGSPIATYNVPTSNLQYFVLLPAVSGLPPSGDTITLSGDTGTTQSTTITVSNVGESRSRLDLEQIGTLSNFSISTLPDNLTPADGTFDITISCTVPPVQAQETLTLRSDENDMPTFRYTLECISNNPSPPTDQPTVTPITSLQNTTNTEMELSIFDPAISKIGFLLPGQVGILGEQIEWVITVTNTSNVVGNNIIITDTLINELQIDRVNAPNSTVSINGQTVSVTYSTLDIGQSVQFSIFTTVLEGTNVTNTACVDADNQGSEKCRNATVVSQLPQTGETPVWRNLLVLSGVVLSALIGLLIGKWNINVV